MFLNNPKRRAPKTTSPVSQRRLKAAHRAIAALVTECMESDSPSKFAAAGRLCSVGQRLVKAVSLSAADHIEDVDGRGQYYTMNVGAMDDAAEFEEVQGGYANPVRQPLRMAPEIEHMLTVIREVLGPNQQAERGEREARELDTLLLTSRDEALSLAHRKVVEARINMLLTNMQERCFPNGTKDIIDCPLIPPQGEPVSLVSSLVVRGHQAGAQGGQGDAAPVPGPDAGGTRRTARAARRRRAEQVG